MRSDNIINVTETDFDFEVLAFSQNTPVIVEFWADWCRPCKQLGPILDQIIDDANSVFRLARVNVDENPTLTVRCGVHSLPTVQAFSQGNMVSNFVGLLPVERVREFVERVAPPSPANLQVEKGNSLLAIGTIDSAEKSFREALEAAPDHPGATLGLIKIALLRGKAQEANRLFRNFPPSRDYSEAEKLQPLIKAMLDFGSKSLPEENDLDAAFSNSIRLAIRGNLLASIDGMMDILRTDAHYRKDKARMVVLGLLELMDPQGEQTLAYRRELTSILFK